MGRFFVGNDFEEKESPLESGGWSQVKLNRRLSLGGVTNAGLRLLMVSLVAQHVVDVLGDLAGLVVFTIVCGGVNHLND